MEVYESTVLSSYNTFGDCTSGDHPPLNVPNKWRFATTQERDAYFTLPENRHDLLDRHTYIIVGADLQLWWGDDNPTNYDNTKWVTCTWVIKGEQGHKGDKGDQGQKGDTGTVDYSGLALVLQAGDGIDFKHIVSPTGDKLEIIATDTGAGTIHGQINSTVRQEITDINIRGNYTGSTITGSTLHIDIPHGIDEITADLLMHVMKAGDGINFSKENDKLIVKVSPDIITSDILYNKLKSQAGTINITKAGNLVNLEAVNHPLTVPELQNVLKAGTGVALAATTDNLTINVDTSGIVNSLSLYDAMQSDDNTITFEKNAGDKLNLKSKQVPVNAASIKNLFEGDGITITEKPLTSTDKDPNGNLITSKLKFSITDADKLLNQDQVIAGKDSWVTPVWDNTDKKLKLNCHPTYLQLNDVLEAGDGIKFSQVTENGKESLKISADALTVKTKDQSGASKDIAANILQFENDVQGIISGGGIIKIPLGTIIVDAHSTADTLAAKYPVKTNMGKTALAYDVSHPTKEGSSWWGCDGDKWGPLSSLKTTADSIDVINRYPSSIEKRFADNSLNGFPIQSDYRYADGTEAGIPIKDMSGFIETMLNKKDGLAVQHFSACNGEIFTRYWRSGGVPSDWLQEGVNPALVATMYTNFYDMKIKTAKHKGIPLMLVNDNVGHAQPYTPIDSSPVGDMFGITCPKTGLYSLALMMTITGGKSKGKDGTITFRITKNHKDIIYTSSSTKVPDSGDMFPFYLCEIGQIPLIKGEVISIVFDISNINEYTDDELRTYRLDPHKNYFTMDLNGYRTGVGIAETNRMTLGGILPTLGHEILTVKPDKTSHVSVLADEYNIKVQTVQQKPTATRFWIDSDFWSDSKVW